MDREPSIWDKKVLGEKFKEQALSNTDRQKLVGQSVNAWRHNARVLLKESLRQASVWQMISENAEDFYAAINPEQKQLRRDWQIRE
ncbi:hypothetical protein OC683_01440, partial ['Crotalaria aegyptiaca' phytoplasma]